MKRVKVGELEEGDLFIRAGRYYEVLEMEMEVEFSYFIRAKCFMAPTAGEEIIGDWIGREIYIPISCEVLLCEEDVG